MTPASKTPEKVERKPGDIVYVKTFAGPIIRVRVVGVTPEGFEGVVHPEDCRRLYLACVAERTPDYVSLFEESWVVSKEEFDKADPNEWIIRVEKKSKKK